MIILVIISLAAMLANEESNFRYIHQIIWGIFLIDVIIRFGRSSVKWKYIKNNPFDIVTVLPLEDSMLLARFARFLRLFRYKNIVKRYADGIRKKLEEIGFFRLSISLFSINFVISLLLTWFSYFGILESSLFVWGNFFKFNYETNADEFILLSVVIKIVGLIYYGIVISEIMTIGRKKYEQFKEKNTAKISEKDNQRGIS